MVGRPRGEGNFIFSCVYAPGAEVPPGAVRAARSGKQCAPRSRTSRPRRPVPLACPAPAPSPVRLPPARRNIEPVITGTLSHRAGRLSGWHPDHMIESTVCAVRVTLDVPAPIPVAGVMRAGPPTTAGMGKPREDHRPTLYSHQIQAIG
jgi:hypothetical protein